MRKKLMAGFKNFKRNSDIFFLALPAVLFIIIFNYVPLYGLILPFKNYKYNLGFFKSPWVGFSNFKYLFNNNGALIATRNTILYNLLFIVAGTVISVAFALMLYEFGRKFVRTYQTVMFFPYFVSWIVAAYLFMSLLDMQFGFLNKLLAVFEIDAVMWYNEAKYWPFIIFFAALWKGTGYSSVIFYSGLMSIDQEYFESAQLDGANRLQQVWHISVPFLTPLISILTIMQVGRIFYSDFGLFYNVTLDSPMIYNVTDVIDTFVYRALRQLGDIGMASAAGFYQSVMGFVLVLAANLVVKKFNEENSLF
jgi:putative aldouronate transport system permease protein